MNCPLCGSHRIKRADTADFSVRRNMRCEICGSKWRPASSRLLGIVFLLVGFPVFFATFMVACGWLVAVVTQRHPLPQPAGVLTILVCLFAGMWLVVGGGEIVWGSGSKVAVLEKGPFVPGGPNDADEDGSATEDLSPGPATSTATDDPAVAAPTPKTRAVWKHILLPRPFSRPQDNIERITALAWSIWLLLFLFAMVWPWMEAKRLRGVNLAICVALGWSALAFLVTACRRREEAR